MKHRNTARLTAFLAAVLLTPALHAATVTVPYNDPFQSTSVGNDPANWIESGSSTTWVIANNGTQNVYQGSRTNFGSFGSQLEFSNLGATTTDFTVSTSFKITDDSATAGDLYIGLSAFGALGDLSSTYYLADVRNTGSLRIISQGGANPGFTSGSGSFGSALSTSTTYTLTLAGTYTTGTLTLSLTLSDGITTSTPVTATDTSPLTGSFFGYRTNNAGGDSVAVQYNNYNVVPEPSAALLLGLGLFGMLSIRRRRA